MENFAHLSDCNLDGNRKIEMFVSVMTHLRLCLIILFRKSQSAISILRSAQNLFPIDYSSLSHVGFVVWP